MWEKPGARCDPTCWPARHTEFQVNTSGRLLSSRTGSLRHAAILIACPSTSTTATRNWLRTRLSQVNGEVDLGYTVDRFSELGFGYEIGWQSYSPAIGNPNVLSSVSGRQSFSTVRYVLDRLDDPIEPRKGVSIAGAFNFFDSRPAAQEKVPALQTTMRFFKPMRRIVSIYFRASEGTTFGLAKTGVPPFTLGRTVAAERVSNE
jgi:hypothetical protein